MLSLRTLLRHPLQFAIMVLGIALGVAAMVSIDLANASAERAFELSTSAVTGRATHAIVASGEGLTLDDLIESLGEAQREAKKAREQGLDARTFQAVQEQP